MRLMLSTIGLLCALAGCLSSGPPGGDIVPPAVLLVTPEGWMVDPDTIVSVKFSEPVDPAALVEELVVVVPAEQVDDAFLQDLDRPPLSAKRSEYPLPCRIDSDMQGGRLLLEPDQPLEYGQAYLVVVSAAVCDLAGNPLVDTLQTDERGRVIGLQTHFTHRFQIRQAPDDPENPGPSGPVFSEVLANPAGTESEGEYLEIVNLGDQPVDLDGWGLDDSGGESAGDRLGPCQEGGAVMVPPGSTALLVGRNFLDPPDLASGTIKVCTDRSTVTPRGLKNGGGEILVLSDPSGREADRYGGWVNLSDREGCAAVRLDLLAPDGPENWAVPEGEPCRSPGWIE